MESAKNFTDILYENIRAINFRGLSVRLKKVVIFCSLDRELTLEFTAEVMFAWVMILVCFRVKFSLINMETVSHNLGSFNTIKVSDAFDTGPASLCVIIIILYHR